MHCRGRSVDRAFECLARVGTIVQTVGQNRGMAVHSSQWSHWFSHRLARSARYRQWSADTWTDWGPPPARTWPARGSVTPPRAPTGQGPKGVVVMGPGRLELQRQQTHAFCGTIIRCDPLSLLAFWCLLPHASNLCTH